MPPANPQPQPAADSANAVTEIAARVEAAEHEEWFPYTEWTMSEAEDALWNRAPDDIRYLLAALTREREALAAMTTRALAAEAALEPFALTDDERYELGTFLDDEDVYMRPDDGVDTVKNAWSKQVTIGNLRTARYVLQQAASADEPTGGVNNAGN